MVLSAPIDVMLFEVETWAFRQPGFLALASAAGVSYRCRVWLSPAPHATMVGLLLVTRRLNRLPLIVRCQVSTARLVLPSRAYSWK